nr:immunoglobulin domain-containing protein [Lachnospiraceae bacterium]
MRQRITKRLTALFLCLVMLGTMIPASAAPAAETELLPVSTAVLNEAEPLTTPETVDAANADKPTITTQPKNVTKNVGETGKFTVKADGATKYQWYWRKNSDSSWAKSTASSATAATLSLKATMARHGCQYRCKVSNSSGYVYTKAVTFTVIGKPEITSQPENVTRFENDTAEFTVAADGAESYQWYWRKNSDSSWAKSTASTATTATLKLKATAARNGCQYRCKVSNGTGSVYTKTVTFTVICNPRITSQPESVTKNVGETAKFTVKAENVTSYQWYWRRDSSSEWKASTASSATSPTLSLKATLARNGCQYRCKVSGSYYFYSDTVTLTVVGKPEITTQPKNITKALGETGKFTVKAVGATKYQWYWRTDSNSSWIKNLASSATTPTLSLKAVAARNGCQYRCKVFNGSDYVYTNAVTFTVTHGIQITSQPANVSISEGGTAIFTVAATNAESYQWYWWKSSTSSWVECGGSDAKTATLKYTEVQYTWDGYYFCCKVSNSLGSVWSTYARLTVTDRHVPVIKTQPQNLTVEDGFPVDFTVKARYADSYQWYWRKKSSDDWTAIVGSSSTLHYDRIYEHWNGYQFRCKVSNSAGYVYTQAATLTVTPANVTYRALLVGEVHYHNLATAERFGADCDRLETALESAQGPAGGYYTVTVEKDLSTQGCKDAISDTFANADANDVSLFFIQTHGATSIASGTNAGRLRMIGATADEHMTLEELANALLDVPGSVIVMIGSCGSGAAIWEGNGANGVSEEDPVLFNEAVVSAFAQAEESLALPNTGEFINSKFYVLTAAAHQEESWGSEEGLYTLFGWYIQAGITNLRADGDGNGTITLSEMYDYLCDKIFGPYGPDGDVTHYQHVQVYPENSSYQLFK